MPEFYEKLYKVRKAAQYGHETTLNPLWVEKNRVDGKKLKHIFDGIYIIVPPGVKLDKKKLKEAVSEADVEEGEEGDE